MDFSELNFFSVISTEQSDFSDIPMWKSNRGPLPNQTGMVSLFDSNVAIQYNQYNVCFNECS